MAIYPNGEWGPITLHRLPQPSHPAGRLSFVLLVYTRRSVPEGRTILRLAEALGVSTAELVA